MPKTSFRKNSDSPIAHFGSANCPVAYQRLKIITPLRLRFPDFKRTLSSYSISSWLTNNNFKLNSFMN
ncbi:hypothetical protein [Bathymodiolus japonicus methanotrophic gill symbiont]|uniref:hypothetical protein n=1 Tax=Bathymodiolus japonicus methanotrophic gill symbiont TaxID=113269 RepID=UPI001C8CF87E|nr:hypothetical protein [Bathymodiolus japonicus methanotrophic gill symbiont]